MAVIGKRAVRRPTVKSAMVTGQDNPEYVWRFSRTIAKALVGFQADPFRMNSEAADARVGASAIDWLLKAEATPSVEGRVSTHPIDAVDALVAVDCGLLNSANLASGLVRADRHLTNGPSLRANDILHRPGPPFFRQ
jgi:hypothetical protein